MTSRRQWPVRVAAVFAFFVGILLLIAGGMHLAAILETRAGQPFDYEFVSLLTTSGILMFPGAIAIATSYWLWHGRIWAYVSCLLSAFALLLYLILLIVMKAQVPGAETAAGDEVYYASVLVVAYILVISSVFLALRKGHTEQPSAA